MPGWLTWTAVRLFLGGLRSKIAAAWNWATESREHMLLIVIAALMLALFGLYWRAAHLEQQLAEQTKSTEGWKKASYAWRGSYERLHAALAVQNAAVAAMKAEADQRTAAGAEALRGAQGRIEAMQGAASRIRAAAPPVNACKTPDAVLAAKGVL